MKKLNLLAAAAVLPFALGACATAGLNDAEQSAVEQEKVMTAAQKRDVKAINHMIPIYIDAAALYKDAAKIPDETTPVRPILTQMAKDRQANREKMQDLVIAMGGTPAKRGEALGTGHRVFTQMRTVVDNDTEVAQEEVLRGERYIIDEINKTIKDGVSPDTKVYLEQLKANAQKNAAKLESL